MNAGRLWFDGGFCDAATLSLRDQGVLFGAGFFETMRVSGGRPVRLDAHLERLRRACLRIGISLPAHFLAATPDEARWVSVLAEAGVREGVVRLTVAAGENAAGLGLGDYGSPHEWLSFRSAPPAPPAEGICLRLLDTRRSSPEWYPRPKSLNYLNSLAAARDLAAYRAEASEEGVLLDASGRVCEGVVSNLFWRRGSRWYTSHEETGCLCGVGRAHLIKALGETGVSVREESAPLDALLSADAVASVGSVRGVVPVRALLARDGRLLANYSTEASRELTAIFGA